MDDNAESTSEASESSTTITFDDLVARAWHDCSLSAPLSPDQASMLCAALIAKQTEDQFLREITTAIHHFDDPHIRDQVNAQALSDFLKAKSKNLSDAIAASSYERAKFEDLAQVEEAKRLTKSNVEKKMVPVLAASKKRTAEAKLWHDPMLEFAKQHRPPYGDIRTGALSRKIIKEPFMTSETLDDGTEVKRAKVGTIQDQIRYCEDNGFLNCDSSKQARLERKNSSTA